MGGWNSGRSGGAPTVERSLTVSLPLMIQRRWIVDGGFGSGTITWSSNGRETGSIGYSYAMWEKDYEWMELRFSWTPYGGEPRSVKQHIGLTATRPHYGGRRWWMLCPQTNKRVLKLHLPPARGQFLSREAWGLGYRSQRISSGDRTLERLFNLQQKLGGEPGWDRGLPRPKGMWQRTYERHLDRYEQLDEAIGMNMMWQLEKLSGRLSGIIGDDYPILRSGRSLGSGADGRAPD